MSIASLLRNEKPRELTADEEKLKRDLYEKISPRRRKFIDRIGYENWDPFPEPNDPIEIRTDITKRTAQQLMKEFMKSKKCEAQLAGESDPGEAFIQGAMEAAIGVVNKQDKFLGAYEFAAWYHELLKKEGHIQ
ncbi:hypothetical protein [uncultured Mailhella sp.]|uniref:hypothetical protein n=1 Tax=uncultured Mailhella sp. TaxID=1981031 RepID=UPI0025F45602|nr:hypothetical protein [uncultured Mailhella sp.]